MDNWLLNTTDDFWIVFLSVILIMTVVIVFTRMFGLRTFAKMTSFDFATTIAIGSVLASTAINPDMSISTGIITLFTIIAFSYLFALVIRKSDLLRSWFTNKPLLLMYKGEIKYENLKKSNIDESELIAKLREANVLDFSEVHAAVLESTGDVSVLHSSEKDLNEKLLKYVQR